MHFRILLRIEWGGMFFQLAVNQGGTIRGAPLLAFNTTTFPDDIWTPIPGVGTFSDSAFSEYRPVTGPDFSTSGLPVTFGLITRNTAGLGFQTGFDNFQGSLSTTPVPEPSSTCSS